MVRIHTYLRTFFDHIMVSEEPFLTQILMEQFQLSFCTAIAPTKWSTFNLVFDCGDGAVGT